MSARWVRSASRKSLAMPRERMGQYRTMWRLRAAVRRRRAAGQRGFTLIELMIVVAIVGILASVALALYVNVQARARLAKAQADVRVIVSAVSMFQGHMNGSLPASIPALTTAATSAQG